MPGNKLPAGVTERLVTGLIFLFFVAVMVGAVYIRDAGIAAIFGIFAGEQMAHIVRLNEAAAAQNDGEG